MEEEIGGFSGNRAGELTVKGENEMGWGGRES